MKIISFLCIGFFLFLSNNSMSQEASDTGNSIHLMFRVLGWQPNEAIGIKYPANVSKEQIQADLAALAQAHGWTYSEKSLEIKYENGDKVAWQGGRLSEKHRLDTNFRLNFQVLRDQFSGAKGIIIDVFGNRGFAYQDVFTSGVVANDKSNRDHQKWRSQFRYEKRWTGPITFGGLLNYRIRYTVDLGQLSENLNLPMLNAKSSFSKVWFLKEFPLVIFAILLPGITAHLFLRRGGIINERGKVKFKPIQFIIIYLEFYVTIGAPIHFGFVHICAAATESTLFGILLSIVPATLICFLILLRILHHYEKASRGTTWSFRENILTNLRMIVLGTPALLLPICFLATQKIFPNLSSFFFILLLLAQYAILTALFACMMPLVLGWIWKGTPLEDEKLCHRLQQLADKAGIDCRNIVLLKTKSSKLANAWVAGILAKWRSVFLTDYLLEHLSSDEIEAIFAHELGHIKHRHLLKQVAWIVLGFGGHLLLARLNLFLFSFLTGIPSWLYWLLFVGVHFGVIFLLVQFGLMRFWRQMEFEADAYAVELTRQATVFLQALRKLIQLNDAPEDLDTFNEMLSTHPNFKARADGLEKLSSRGDVRW